MKEKILLVQIAAGGYNFFAKNLGGVKLDSLEIKPIRGFFPALTCPVQAAIRTAKPASSNGIVGNGFFSTDFRKPLFWEQNSGLIKGERIWEKFRAQGGTVAQLFIQQSLGTDSDYFLSPAPIHKHHGGMIMECLSDPPELYERLESELGLFPLNNYWGPFASEKSSEWIVKAVTSVMENEKPDFLYTYIPHLDYDLQRSGPGSREASKAFITVKARIEELLAASKKEDYRIILFGDYSMLPVDDVIFPNKMLETAGLFATRNIRGMLYPNFYTSSAFAVADHQVAHVHVFDPEKMHEVRLLFEKIAGIDEILDGKKAEGISNERSGELVLVAKKNSWFDYRWWDTKKEAPEYAPHVDIHNKPGYDPCELFKGLNPFKTGQDPQAIKGSHGRVDADEPVLYSSNIEFAPEPKDLLELAECVKNILDKS
jgi:predicted AlkP superfamily pyrophosphatase or phosphodiesterase